MASDKTLTVTGENFESEVLGSEVPVVVDFWAAWCGPCRLVAPVLDQIAEDRAGQVRIAKLNVDENQDLAIRYQVLSIPTLILFKGGQAADRVLGAMPKGAIDEFIDRNL